MSEPVENGDCTKKDNNKNDDVSASHFALQIALQTMKERCQLLQQRLSAVEEENLRLRIESQNNSRKKSVEGVPASEISKLEEKITQLSRQKCQLIDRITMVAKENNQLWTRLSRVTEANQSLGNHLSKINDSLNKHPIGEVSKKSESELLTSKRANISSDVNKEESLEEISLKIIDTIRKEKKVLERQCEEMVELQTGTASVEECGFTLTANGDIASGAALEIEEDLDGGDENENTMVEDIRRLREKMKDDYKTLRDQQAGLRAAIASVNILIAENKNCKCKGAASKEENDRNSCKYSEARSQDFTTMSTAILSPSDEMRKRLQEVAEPPTPQSQLDGVVMTESRQAGEGEEQLSSNLTENNNDAVYKYVDDRICPLCSKFYSQKVPFEEFHQHVLSHFSNEGPDDDSLIGNFENHS